jgi:competence protein ComEA
MTHSTPREDHMHTQFQTDLAAFAVFAALGRRSALGLCALLLCVSSHALEINQANAAELDSLRGMGPALSAKVLQARAQKPFESWRDVMKRVSGFGPAKAQQFSDQGLTVNGQPLKP